MRSSPRRLIARVMTSYQLSVVTVPWYQGLASGELRATISTFEKARRIGGSTAAAIRALMLLAGRELRPDGTFSQREPMDVHVVSKDFIGSKNLLREIGNASLDLAPLDPALTCTIQATSITLRSTGKIAQALPCSAAACRSNTGAVMMDEVAFWRQPEEVFAAAKIIADPNLSEPRGYPIMMVTTPWDSGSLAHQLFTDPERPYVRHRVDIYDAVKAGFPIDIERARVELGIPELFATEYECVWSRGGASFFAPDKLRDCQEDELPADWERAPCRVGIDVGGGRGRDFTAIVQWRLIGGVQWMVGVKAFNDLPIDVQVDTTADWLIGLDPTAHVDIRVDQGVMGLDFIRLLQMALKSRRRTTIQGVAMGQSEQEQYAIAGRRLLERQQMRLYTGTQAGGDEHGARTLMLELSQLKAKPGQGGRLTFATPRDPTKGHCDRAWAGLIGLAEADDVATPILRPTRMPSGGRWSGMAGSRGFG